MRSDIRETAVYHEAEIIYASLRQPGSGCISDAAELDVSPDARHAVFTATIVDALEGAMPTRICRVDCVSGDTQLLTSGPHSDRLPKHSPNGQQIAFLSDCHGAGDFQLYLLNSMGGAACASPAVDGWVEYFHWSPDGERILLGVAGYGADTAIAQGAVASRRKTGRAATWLPTVRAGHDEAQWRRLWIYELAAARVRQVSRADMNVWEAVWCGNHAIAAVSSTGPAEGQWYGAHLQLIDAETGASSQAYAPADQLGCLAAAPSGGYLAFVEAFCSDRGLVAGELRLFDRASGKQRCVDTQSVDIACTQWQSDRHLLLAGHRGFETVVGMYDLESDGFTPTWSSREITTGGYGVSVAAMGPPGDCALIGEGFTRAPEFAVIRSGGYSRIKTFATGYVNFVEAIGAVEPRTWFAPDGLQIEGWLLRPNGSPPYPLVMHVHGGPVWHWRPTWLGRRNVSALMLLKGGYAIFLPNPRGSSGRGQGFARRVRGDMGGADTLDCLSGIDHLVDAGIADPRRLGVMGNSYGGFMSAWLITQDTRFAAAVAVAPITNPVTQRLISNIPQFVDAFLGDRYCNPGGRYFERSPVMHAHKASTPTLSICGALDRCTPPEEAVQFHNALLDNGVESVLVTYPEEGHGVRMLPASIDFTARVVSWLDSHLRL